MWFEAMEDITLETKAKKQKKKIETYFYSKFKWWEKALSILGFLYFLAGALTQVLFHLSDLVFYLIMLFISAIIMAYVTNKDND